MRVFQADGSGHAARVGWASRDRAGLLATLADRRCAAGGPCDDGEFVLKLQVRRRFDGSGTTFNWNVVSGTGAYENLRGAGRGIGTPLGDGVLDTHEGGLHID